MFGSNGHYGHRWILNRYAGVPVGTPIPGNLEHGWNYNLGATQADIEAARPDPFYLWSERNLRACRDVGGLDHVVPLGAPFLYMPPLEAPVEAEPGSLLVMPAHGWERCRLQHDFELYARHLSEIEKRFRTITVCLYWFEYQEKQYRAPFESRGYRVITSGQRDQNPTFLLGLRRLILRHEYVSSNRVQTPTFYALHLGRKFFVCGPPVGVEQWVDPTGKLYHAWQSAEYPMLMEEGFRDETYPDIGAKELGLEFLRTPEALRALFLWEPSMKNELAARVKSSRERFAQRKRSARAEAWRQAFASVPLIGRMFSS